MQTPNFNQLKKSNVISYDHLGEFMRWWVEQWVLSPKSQSEWHPRRGSCSQMSGRACRALMADSYARTHVCTRAMHPVRSDGQRRGQARRAPSQGHRGHVTCRPETHERWRDEPARPTRFIGRGWRWSATHTHTDISRNCGSYTNLETSLSSNSSLV